MKYCTTSLANVFGFMFYPITILAFPSSQLLTSFELLQHKPNGNAHYAQSGDQHIDFDESSTSDLNRRGFLSDAAVSAMAFSTSSSGLFTDKVSAEESMATGGANLSLPAMGLGAWAWGDSLFWGYDPKQDSDLKQVFDYAVDKDLAFFDTAELYGIGRSETLIGKFRKEYNEDSSIVKKNNIQIATKFAALPWRTKPQAVLDACKASLNRLGSDKPIDLYQIHFPNAWANAEYWDGLAMCYEQGLVKAVGVSNYGVDALRATHAALAERGIPLASNQIQLSLLYRWPLENGLLDACKELDVKVLSYSPLALGFLTGKYTKDNLPSGPRKVIGEKLFLENENFEELVESMRAIASNHENASLSQVALNWARAKGSIPIPGARTLNQAKQNIDALAWTLSTDEINALDDIASKVPSIASPDASPFPKKDINTGLTMFDS